MFKREKYVRHPTEKKYLNINRPPCNHPSHVKWDMKCRHCTMLSNSSAMLRLRRISADLFSKTYESIRAFNGFPAACAKVFRSSIRIYVGNLAALCMHDRLPYPLLLVPHSRSAFLTVVWSSLQCGMTPKAMVVEQLRQNVKFIPPNCHYRQIVTTAKLSLPPSCHFIRYRKSGFYM